MNRFGLLMLIALFVLVASNASAQTSLFVTDPGTQGAPAPISQPTALGAVIEYPVTPNVLAIAARMGRLRIPLPGKPALLIDSRRFDPVAGFIIDANGDVVVDPHATAQDISFNWYGVGDGVEVSIAVHRGTMSGRLQTRNGLYTVALSRDAQNAHVLRKLDPKRFPRALEDTPAAGAPSEYSLPAAGDTRRPDAADPVSILVVYTANALAAAGGQAGIDALIQQSISDLTQSLWNSDVVSIIPQLVTPGGANGVQIVYDENPGITDIVTRWYAHRTFARTDATIQGLRNANAADLVVMLVGDTGVCGVAYTQRPNCGGTAEPGCSVGAGYSGFAESIVSTQCASPLLTFPHEVGHQFGMEHDRPNGAGAGAASYLWSYGYTVSTGSVQARTIMAYDVTCGFGCPVYMNYSNPNVNFAAFPTTPTGTTAVDGGGRWTFNARTAALLAPAMSNFRGVAITDRIFRNDFEALPDIP